MLDPLIQVWDLGSGDDHAGGFQCGADLLPAVVESNLGDLEEDLLVEDIEGCLAGCDADECRIHFGAGVEPGCRYGFHYLAVCAVEQVHGQTRVVGTAHIGDHAVRELLLDHDDGRPESVVQELEYDRCGDAVGQVAHENVELRESGLHGICMDQPQPVAVGLGDVVRQDVIDLDACDVV